MAISTNDTLPPGHRLHWYQIQAILGEGGFGTTYVGRDTNLSQAVAIKEYYPRSYVSRLPDRRVRPRAGVDARFYQWGLKRFLEEARLLARFRHPNIVRVLSVFEALGTAYMVMELERGRSFGRAIIEGSVYSDACLMDVCMPLLDGLQLVHGAGFIHRDIKPNNILMRERLGPVLIDFGSARQPVPSDGRELTAIVSRGYAPFEQYDAGNEDAQGPWTDVYGMAATLYHAVTGALPTEALTRGMAMLNDDPDPLVPAVQAGSDFFSEEMLRAIDIGMAFRPEERPQSIAEWLGHFPTHSAGKAAPEVRTEALEISSEALAQFPGYEDPAGASSTVSGALDEAEEGSTALNHSLHRNLFKGRHFVVLDDEASERRLAQRVLSRLGAGGVELTPRGELALERLRGSSELPRILLCDLDMPGMDGLQVIRELAQQRLQVPVVLLGGDDDRLRVAARSVAEGYGVSVLGSLRKPLTPAALARVLGHASEEERSIATEFLSEEIDDDALREGLRAGAVELLYQPCVSLSSNAVRSIEALVRWRGYNGTLLEPARFLARIEGLGLSPAFGDRVLALALAQAGEWRSMGIGARVSVNMFAPTLKQVDLPETLVAAAEQEGVDPASLTLEVNELRFAEAGGSPLEVLARLRLRGVGLSLDNFGTGLADLDQLRQVPFTELKANPGHVISAHHDAAAYAILESTVSLARRLEMHCVAVGVESARIWDLVADLGFDAAQGFHIATPMEPAAIPAWVKSWQRGKLH